MTNPAISNEAQVSAEVAYLEAYMKSKGDHIRATRAALEAAAPHMLATLAAEVAYQTARAEYFRYAPEIEFDPEGVQRLKDAMHAAKAELKPSE